MFDEANSIFLCQVCWGPVFACFENRRPKNDYENLAQKYLESPRRKLFIRGLGFVVALSVPWGIIFFVCVFLTLNPAVHSVIRHANHCYVLFFLSFPTSRGICNNSSVTLHSLCLTRRGDLPIKRKWLLPQKVSVCLKNMYTAYWPYCVRTLPQQCLLLERIKKICSKEHSTVIFLDEEVFLELCEDVTSTFVHCYNIYFIFRQGVFARLVQRCYFDFCFIDIIYVSFLEKGHLPDLCKDVTLTFISSPWEGITSKFACCAERMLPPQIWDVTHTKHKMEYYPIAKT